MTWKICVVSEVVYIVRIIIMLDDNEEKQSL